MKKFIQFDQISKDTLINVGGTALIGLIGLVFYILVARNLGPEQFGLFTVAASILVISADIFDFGSNSGIVKFVAEALVEKNYQKAAAIAKFAFVFKLVVGLALMVVGFIVARPLAINIFHQKELVSLLHFAFFGVIIILFLGFFTSILQAFKRFFDAVLINLTANIVRLIVVAVLLGTGFVNNQTAMAAFAFSPIVGVLAGFLKSPLKLSPNAINRGLALKFLGFNKWIAAGFILAAIQVRLPSFLLIRLSDSTQTGLFSAASTLILFAPQVATALSVTFAPSFSQIAQIEAAKQFFQKAILVSLSFALLSLILIPLASTVLNLTVGSQFLKATSPFQILAISAVFLILSVPQTTAIIYYFSKPQLYAAISAVQLIIIFSLNLLLIPDFGATGSAVAVLLATITGFSITTIYLLLKWQKL